MEYTIYFKGSYDVNVIQNEINKYFIEVVKQSAISLFISENMILQNYLFYNYNKVDVSFKALNKFLNDYNISIIVDEIRQNDVNMIWDSSVDGVEQLGVKFMTYRKYRMLEISELAKDLNVTLQTLQKYEKGTSKWKLNKFLKYCQILGLRITFKTK